MKCPNCGAQIVGYRCMYCGTIKEQDSEYVRIRAQTGKVHMTISGSECVEITALGEKDRTFLTEEGKVIKIPCSIG